MFPKKAVVSTFNSNPEKAFSHLNGIVKICFDLATGDYSFKLIQTGLVISVHMMYKLISKEIVDYFISNEDCEIINEAINSNKSDLSTPKVVNNDGPSIEQVRLKLDNIVEQDVNTIELDFGLFSDKGKPLSDGEQNVFENEYKRSYPDRTFVESSEVVISDIIVSETESDSETTNDVSLEIPNSDVIEKLFTEDCYTKNEIKTIVANHNKGKKQNEKIMISNVLEYLNQFYTSDIEGSFKRVILLD